MIATPESDGVNNAQHATISGTVSTVTDRYVGIEAAAIADSRSDLDPLVYWTRCAACGEYVARPDTVGPEHPLEVTCAGCR